MNECKKIESLIYLYRKGELSADESKRVLEHTKKCSHCREIIQQLLSIDTALSPLREKDPDLSGDASLVNETIDRIVKINVGTGVSGKKTLDLDVMFGWLRPALSFIVLAATVLFATQQSQDAQKISDLETHLQATEGIAGSVVPYTNSDAKRLLDIVTTEQKKDFSFFQSSNKAGIGWEPLKMVGSEIFELFKQKNGLFDYLSSRYPNLTSVTLEDGISDRERKILATEGKTLMKELEQLFQEGEK